MAPLASFGLPHLVEACEHFLDGPGAADFIGDIAGVWRTVGDWLVDDTDNRDFGAVFENLAGTIARRLLGGTVPAASTLAVPGPATLDAGVADRAPGPDSGGGDDRIGEVLDSPADIPGGGGPQAGN